jgi:hypothetical protein
MISERFLSISVKERRPPHTGQSGTARDSLEHWESCTQQLPCGKEPLTETPCSEVFEPIRGSVTSVTGQVQEAAVLQEATRASGIQHLRTSEKSSVGQYPANPEELSQEEVVGPDNTLERRVAFDLTGCVIREPLSDRPFKIEEVDSVQGFEKLSFSICDLLLLTGSTLLQQKIAALKAINNIFRATFSDTLTRDEVRAVLEEFEASGGLKILVQLLEIPNYQIFLYILEIASFLILEVETSLSQFEERWSIIGLLEEDLEKLGMPQFKTDLDNDDGLSNDNIRKKVSLAARLTENFFLSKFLDKMRRLENIHALSHRAYRTLAELFKSYIVYYWFQEEEMRTKVVLEVGKVLVKNRASYDVTFISKMISWCFIILPTWKEGLNTALALESEDVLYYKIRTLRITMQLNNEELLHRDVLSYVKNAFDIWKNSDYSVKTMPCKECLLLCIEYCKVARGKNIFLNSDASRVFEDGCLLFDYVVHNQNCKDNEEMSFYVLLISELLVNVFWSSPLSVRCYFEKKMEASYNFLVNLLNEFEGLEYSQLESRIYEQDNRKQSLLFATWRIAFLFAWTLNHRLPNLDNFISLSWKAITRYEFVEKDVFGVSTDFYSCSHLYYMTLFLADVHLKRFLGVRALPDFGRCFRLVSVMQSLRLLHVAKNYFSCIFTPETLFIACNNWDDAQILSSFLESQIENILRNYREFWWWTTLRPLFDAENTNKEQLLVLLMRFFVFLVKRTDVFESSYVMFFYKMMKQVLTGMQNWYYSVEEELKEFFFYILSYDSCYSCSLYLETADAGSSLVDSLVDMAYAHLFSNDIVFHKMTEVFQTTILHFLLNPCYKEEFRLSLWRKCVKSNFQLCDSLWITGPLCHYVKRCNDDLCFMMEALGDFCRGIVNREACYFVFKSLCIRVAKTVFEEPHYWHLLNVMLYYSSVNDMADIITQVFVSDFFQDDGKQTPQIYTQVNAIQIFASENASEDKIKERLRLAAKCYPSFHQLLFHCPFLHSLWRSSGSVDL